MHFSFVPSRILAASLVARGCASAGRAETTIGNWAIHCAKCHAADGSGETPYGRKMAIRDYRDPTIQTSFTDEELQTCLLRGLNKEGKILMVPFADRLGADEIRDLVIYVRGLPAGAQRGKK